MDLRLAVAAAAIGMAHVPALAQNMGQAPVAAQGEVMSCSELQHLRSDQRRWDQIARSTVKTDKGWVLRSKRLGMLDRQEKLIETAEYGRKFAVTAELGFHIGAVLSVENENPRRNQLEKLTYYHRWVSARPYAYESAAASCSKEDVRRAESGATNTFALRLDKPEDTENQYAFVAYDNRKNILFTATFEVAPRRAVGTPSAKSESPEGKASDAEENAAALRVAYSTLLLLERCSEQYVSGAPLSVSRDRVARIEKSAAAMGIDVRAAKAKAQQDSKANMDMFDMFEALGAMNYQQRDSLKQFCAVQGTTLLDVSKHFAELDRAAGR